MRCGSAARGHREAAQGAACGPKDHKAGAHQHANFFWSTTPSRTGMKRNVFFMPGIDVYFCSTVGRLISAVGVYSTTTSLIVLFRCDCTYSSVLKLAFTCSATCKARVVGARVVETMMEQTGARENDPVGEGGTGLLGREDVVAPCQDRLAVGWPVIDDVLAHRSLDPCA